MLHRLVDAGNTVLVIEHNLDVIKTADRIVDLGPEGGARGGQIIAEGTPEDVAHVAGSATGEYLARVLRGEPLVPLSDVTFAEEAGRRKAVPRRSAGSDGATLVEEAAANPRLRGNARRSPCAAVAERGHVPARHETPEIDAAALEAGRAADRLLASAVAVGSQRWTRYLATMPDQFRDDPIPSLRATARAARSAFGPKDSIRDTLPAAVTEPFLDAVDRLLRLILRWELHRDR